MKPKGRPSDQELSRLSEAAYCEEGEARRRAKIDGWTLVYWLDEGPTEGFVAVREHGADVVVAFRGTAQAEDILVDIKAHKIDPLRRNGWPGGRVHGGFEAAIEEAWPALSSALLRLRQARGGIAVHFTGHSLGAALATLAAARATATQTAAVASLVTFGSPRVGDLDFARSFDDLPEGTARRYVNNSDVVPRLLFFTFFHVCASLYITRAGALVENPGLWFVFWDVLLGRIQARLINPFRLKTDGLADHPMARYRERLEAFEF